MATNWNMSETEPLIEPSENHRHMERSSTFPAHIEQSSVSTYIEATTAANFLRDASVTVQAPESLSSDGLPLEEPSKSQTWPRRRVPQSSPTRRGSLPARLSTERYPESILSSHSLEITGSSNMAYLTDASAMYYQFQSWEPIESALDSDIRALLDAEDEKRQFARTIYAMCACTVMILIICGFVAAYAMNESSDSGPAT